MAGKHGMLRTPLHEVYARVDRALALREKGWTDAEIAEKFGIRTRTLQKNLRDYADASSYKRREPVKCALFECKKVVPPTTHNAKYCSRRHFKRDNERKRRGQTARQLECRMPFCKKTIVTVGDGDKFFCDLKHTAKFDSRRRIDYYEKLVERIHCAACDYWGPGLQQHHVHFRCKGGSDSRRNLVWLCPTHHMMIHAGLARFDGAAFVDLREEIRTEEIRKRQLWNEPVALSDLGVVTVH